MQTRYDLPAFIIEVKVTKYQKQILKPRQGAISVWQNVQQLHGRRFISLIMILLMIFSL